jgi:RNA dependent RNA polymerase
VTPFQTTDADFNKEPPHLLSDYFEQDIRRVSEVAGPLSIDSEKFVNFGINTSFVDSELGTCTHRHRDLVYAHGFEHPLAILMAQLASRLVDAPKQGLRLKAEKWEELLRSLNTKDPEYIKPTGAYKMLDSNHVMDVLVLKVIPEFVNSVFESFHAKLGTESPMDPDIKDFYTRMLSREELRPMLRKLKDDLKNLQHRYLQFYAKWGHRMAQNREEILLTPRKTRIQSLNQDERSEMVPPHILLI